MKIAELLRSRRQAMGMSLEDVADATGSSKSYVWELENGKSYKMGLTLAARFALVLGINVNMMAVAALETERDVKGGVPVQWRLNPGQRRPMMTVEELIQHLQVLVETTPSARFFPVLIPVDQEEGSWGPCSRPQIDEGEVLL